jgi:hypothetical protein
MRFYPLWFQHTSPSTAFHSCTHRPTDSPFFERWVYVSCLHCFELQLSHLFWATVVSLVLRHSCLLCFELQTSPLFWATVVSLVLSYSCLPCSETQLSPLFWTTVVSLILSYSCLPCSDTQLSPLFWTTIVSLVLIYHKWRGLRKITGLQSPEFSQPTEHNHTISLVFADCVITNEKQQSK